ncbi:hypothetical protein LSCM1_02127 [Leishmania martiniquensis]|uniref:ATP-binding cassette protein subfamily C, member 8 n=1 Tax=Leishmania martiniquensis TaxID=1580590 RepID=A0A836GQK6_9TRYP|nr:hypothetical protein LSCM1_02127 [Leishmania martiniquensis]
MGKVPDMAARASTVLEVKASWSLSTFLVHGVLRRVPGYTFFFIHLCFLHILWGQLVDHFFNSALTFTSANVSNTELAKDAFIHMFSGLCRAVDQALVHGVADVFKRKGGMSVTSALGASRESLAFLWKSPSSMVLFFGLAFISLNGVLTALRVLTSSVSSLAALCQSRPQRKHGGSRKPVPLRITVRYGNGYDSVLRFILASVELAWFMNYPVLNSAAAVKSTSGKAHRMPGATEPTYASLRQLQVRQQAIASFQIEASLLLPPQMFDSAADAIAAGVYVILFVKMVLGIVVALDAQRLFHALVGVRPLSIPNGWERCPVCGALWKRSRESASAVHLCPNIFTATPTLAASSSGATASAAEEEEEGVEDMPAHVPGTVRRVAGDRGRIGTPTEVAHRPGDAFPDPDTASFASLITDSWLDPLMNFTLLSPLNTFSPPPLSSIDDGPGHWRALQRVVDRLPRPPHSLCTRDRIGDPAWTLWQRRHELSARGEVGWLERIFSIITAPIRRVLSRAFAVFFLPPSARGGDTQEDGFGPVRGGPSLFHVFLRHPCGCQFVFACVPLKLTQDLLSLLAPRVVKSLVAFLKEVSVSNTSVRQSYLSRGLVICLSLILVVSLQALFFQLYLTHLYAVCLKSTSALKTLLLRHSLTTPLAYTGSSRGGGGKRAPASPSAPDRPQSPIRLSRKSDGGGKEALPLSTAKSTAEEVTSAATLSREGEVMSLLTVDVTNCADCLIFLHNVWGHPFVIISSLMSMYTYVGLFSTLATFAALIALIPLNRSSAARVRAAQQQAKNNESRLSDLTAALSSMRTVKSMALEECLVGRVEEARVRESDGTKRVGQAESVAAAQTEVTTLLVALVCCGSYLLTGGAMDAAVLVPTMAALQVMRFPVWTLPQLYSQVSRGYTSMQRIERFLSEREAGEHSSAAYVEHILRQREGEGVERERQTSATAAVKVGEVRCAHGTFAWNVQAAVADQIAFDNTLSYGTPKGSRGGIHSPNALSKGSDKNGEEDPPSASTFSAYSSPRQGSSRAVVLHDIALDILPGEFVVLHGPTGCGKSALLLSMLGELYTMPNDSHVTGASRTAAMSSEARESSGNHGFQIGGRVAYCAEVPWLRQGTLRENIRLVSDDVPESAKEREWYERVLEACALKNDIKALAKGDRSVVGEGGSKLSGGQRARVALARAVYRYSETDVFLFDDVLSALDVEVQKHLIANLFHGLLRTAGYSSTAAPRRAKTVVLATHAAVDLLMPDRVLHLWPDGTLHEDTTYQAPTENQVHQQKSAWRHATAVAATTKEQRRSIRLQASGVAAANSSVHQSGPTLPQSTKTNLVREAPRKPSVVPAVQQPATDINSLLPRAADLHRLFIEYIGGGRLLWFFVLSVSMQLFRTLMDNWLGVYISLYDKRNAAYETILRSTKSQRARKFMFDILSLVVLRGEKATPPPPPPVVPAFTVFGVPLLWRNPFVLDTVVAQFLGTYAFIGFSAALLSMIRTDYFFRSYQRMADALQLHAVRKLFRASVSYFDRIPSSRLLQILSRDQEVVDRALGESVQLISMTILQLLGMACFNVIHFGPFIAVLPISALLFYHLTVRFLSFTKQVRALEGVLQSRLVSVMKDAVNGAITIRAFGSVLHDQLVEEMNQALDAVHVAANAGLTADRWVALRLEFVALAFTSALALLSVLTVCLSGTASASSAAFAGLGITSSMTASRSLSMLCRRFGMFQNQFVSAEQLLRLEEEIIEEAAPAVADSRSEDESPASEQHTTSEPGTYLLLDVRHLCAKYQPQLPWVLTDICFTLHPGECVGLIGRTGNGKSSIFNALLGLMDVVEGDILIPSALVTSSPGPKARQLNALHLPQHELRRNYFQLVSQEPLLLEGTCRSNLMLGFDGGSAASAETSDEPWDTADAEALDARLSAVLRKVALDELLEPPYAAPIPGQPAVTAGDGEVASSATGDAPSPSSDSTASTSCTVDAATRALDHVVNAGGSNLSAGQRQLLCLARAILHRPRVVLLDEVSSRVDRRTDDLIQRVIKEEMLCRGHDSKQGGDSSAVRSGVLLIAHRLETIMSLCDSVIVIEKGRCVVHLSKEEVTSLEDLESYL